MSLIYAVILFGFLIFIHELGHFLAAKLSGVRVLKFSIGFGPKILGKKIGETEYLLSAVPLGGYVKMYGEEVGDEIIDEKRSFKHQPVYKKIFIVLAGPLFNIFGAVLLFWVIFVHGVPVLKPIIGEIIENSPAKIAGLEKGDRIIELDSQKINNWFDMAQFIQQNPNKELIFKIERKGEILNLKITPQAKEAKNLFGEKVVVGQIGIKPADEFYIKKEDPITAVTKSFQKCYEIVELTYLTIVKIFQRVVSTDVIGGPILIFQAAGKTAEQGLVSFLSFAAIISINLGVLNLLPIPVLDGGHILFFMIEGIRRKPLSEKFVAVSQKIGIAFLIALMMLAFYNDIIRLLNPSKMP
ncbi:MULTISPECIES: RIP metalloprotease RseP [Thermodesulfovibrio]|uniref:Zinc metalloprotease n=2 Tax=Thermodesulfovibrio yellowstonii TaxID=28262 RepID=A0A9W6GIJ3_9BACT|nr:MULTISPECIES: RIP metalloprotease RseP [Thermodesulfovibrio]GLI54411.1 zinc metalloprotease [Thermodesulfovibrio islandicus]